MWHFFHVGPHENRVSKTRFITLIKTRTPKKNPEEKKKKKPMPRIREELIREESRPHQELIREEHQRRTQRRTQAARDPGRYASPGRHAGEVSSLSL